MTASDVTDLYVSTAPKLVKDRVKVEYIIFVYLRALLFCSFRMKNMILASSHLHGQSQPV